MIDDNIDNKIAQLQDLSNNIDYQIMRKKEELESLINAKHNVEGQKAAYNQFNETALGEVIVEPPVREDEKPTD